MSILTRRCCRWQTLNRQHESSDNQSSEEFADSQGRKKGDGHRQFHRHLPFDDVLEGFLEYRTSTDQSG
jgi:hypothetical protein